MTKPPTKPVEIAAELREATRDLRFGPPVAYVYHPLDYAWEVHRQYLERFTVYRPQAMFIGMNPGPFGMAQIGVPFGAVTPAREWLGLDAPVAPSTDRQHPKRPIEGWACRREEVSGERFWGWARSFGPPEVFFRQFFVYNYCPLLFLAESGANLTPDKLAAGDRAPMLPLCDRSVRRMAEALGVSWVIGVGAWAAGRASAALGPDSPIKVGRILHPSPASPIANRDWAGQAEAQLRALGLELPSNAAKGPTD